MNKKKYIFTFILIITVIFSTVLLNLSKNKKDFIYVVPNIKNFEVLEKNIGEYSLIPIKNKLPNKIGEKSFLNGYIFFNVPNNEYILKGKYHSDTDEVILNKNKDWQKVRLNLEGLKFSKNQELFLNFLTLCLIIFTVYISINSKHIYASHKKLKFIYYLLLGKMFLSLRTSFQNDYTILLEFTITRVLLFMLIFYILNNIVQKKFKNFRLIIYILLGIIYFYNLIIFLTIYSPQVYVYLTDEAPYFLNIIRTIRHSIDLTRIIFIISIFQFFIKKDQSKIRLSFNWIIIAITYFILEFFRDIFPCKRNLYYFIELIEIFYIYWFLIFYTFKIYTKNGMRIIRYSLGVVLSYISLFYFKTLTEPMMALITLIILDFYTNIIENIVNAKNSQVEKIYNRLCLINDINFFKIQLEKEIKKNISIQSVNFKLLIEPDDYHNYIQEQNFESIFIEKYFLKIDSYDYAYRIEFNENKYIGIILIKESESSLTIEEQNFLKDLTIKIASLVSQLRMNLLYKGLNP